jgi:hypothetical protein
MQLNLRIKDTLWGHYIISLLTYFCHVCPLTILKFKWNFISERLHEEEKINQTSSSFEGHSRYYFTVVLVFEESTVGGSTVLVLLDRKQSTCMHNQLLSAHFVAAIFQVSQQTYPFAQSKPFLEDLHLSFMLATCKLTLLATCKLTLLATCKLTLLATCKLTLLATCKPTLLATCKLTLCENVQ